MSEHSPASTSEFSSIRTGFVKPQESKPAQMARQAQEQASQAGEYVARNVQAYPLVALLVAGLIGYGVGLLIHTSWSSERREQTSAPEGHPGDVLQPLE